MSSSSYSSPEDTLRYALEHLLVHYLADVDCDPAKLWETHTVQYAVRALKSVGVDFPRSSIDEQP